MHFLRALLRCPIVVDLLIAAVALILEYALTRWGSRQPA